jgi:hypothetical protein
VKVCRRCTAPEKSWRGQTYACLDDQGYMNGSDHDFVEEVVVEIESIEQPLLEGASHVR